MSSHFTETVNSSVARYTAREELKLRSIVDEVFTTALYRRARFEAREDFLQQD
jgi:hypothetical protein